MITSMNAKHHLPPALRRTLRAALPGALALGVLASPAIAGAAPAMPRLPDAPAVPGSDEIGLPAPDAGSDLPAGLPDRDQVNDAIDQSGIPVPREARDAIGRAFPEAPKPAPRPAPAPKPAPDRTAPPASPCPKTARVCVDIDNARTWLQQDGRLVHGPVPTKTGRAGQETPRGTFHVTRKVKDEVSREFGNAPMPYAVYFTNNGHAFHEGSLDGESAGCVRLNHADAKRFFEFLQVGDEVFIY